MCQIIVVPAGKKVNMKNLDKAQKHNQDGYGVSWFEDGMVKTYKTMDYNTFKGVISSLKKYSKIVHLRYATVGDVNVSNCHPFEVPTGVMFHNGTINGMTPPRIWKNGKYEQSGSDSSEMAKLLSAVDYDSIDAISPLILPIIGDKINRMVFMEDDGEITILNSKLGIEDDGIWYSNDYHLKADAWCRNGYCNPKVKDAEKAPNKSVAKKKTTVLKEGLTRVFVYGTLKRGYTNHKYFLSDAIFLGKASTQDKWTMIGEGRGFPYVVERDDIFGHNVIGEVFLVDKAQLTKLDSLEGVASNHYKKVVVPISYQDNGSKDYTTMYVACEKPVGYTGAKKLVEWVR